MRLLILGGTVFLGRHVAGAALAAGHHVTVFTRGLHGAPGEGVEHLRGDRTGDLSALRAGRWDAVVDTSGYDPTVVAASTEALADRVEHLVFVSSGSAYRDWPAAAVDEDSPVWTDAADEYGPAKAECERVVTAAMPGRSTIVRAGLLCGPHDNVFRLPWWLERVARGGDVLAPGHPSQPLQLIDARDLAAWMVMACEQRISGTFNGTAPPGCTTTGQVLDAAVAVTGSDARLRWVPDAALLQAGVEPWTDLPLWAPPLPGFEGTWQMATDRIQAAGLRCRPVDEIVADTWAWLEAGGAGELDDWRAEVRPTPLTPERERALLALAHPA
jgi:2'-hydroxyisoflavone reductase